MSLSKVYKTEGIVIKRSNTGETDKIILLFTKDFGKIRVLAKGIRRITSHRSGHLDLFSHVQVSLYKGKTMDLVREATRVPGLETNSPRNSLHRTVYSFYLCELIDKLTPEGQKHTDVYDLLVGTFHELSKSISQDQSQTLLFRFARELLWKLGFLPQVSKLSDAAIKPYIERLIERKLSTPSILTVLPRSE